MLIICELITAWPKFNSLACAGGIEGMKDGVDGWFEEKDDWIILLSIKIIKNVPKVIIVFYSINKT